MCFIVGVGCGYSVKEGFFLNFNREEGLEFMFELLFSSFGLEERSWYDCCLEFFVFFTGELSSFMFVVFG